MIIIHYNIFEASRGPGKRKIKLQEENILRLMQEENNESDEEDRDFEVDQVESDGKYLRIFTALLNSLSWCYSWWAWQISQQLCMNKEIVLVQLYM